MSIILLVQRIGHGISTSVQYLGPWLSTLALCISVGAFIVSSLQYKAVTRHYRLSVKPHVIVTFYLEGTREGGLSEKNGIYLENPGLGPAIIKAISVEAGGKSYSAVNKHPWRNVLQDLAIVPNCFKFRLMQPGSALKSGEERPLLTVTQANPPVIDGRSCHIELWKLLKAEGLKVHVQYESMYGEPDETIAESPVDSDIISDISTALVQQLAPKLAAQLQGMVQQLTQHTDQMQQLNVDHMKRQSALAKRMMLHQLYVHPLIALWDQPTPGTPPQ
jgi:hypothetical protein